jgi:hypothetical protein
LREARRGTGGISAIRLHSMVADNFPSHIPGPLCRKNLWIDQLTLPDPRETGGWPIHSARLSGWTLWATLNKPGGSPDGSHASQLLGHGRKGRRVPLGGSCGGTSGASYGDLGSGAKGRPLTPFVLCLGPCSAALGCLNRLSFASAVVCRRTRLCLRRSRKPQRSWNTRRI